MVHSTPIFPPPHRQLTGEYNNEITRLPSSLLRGGATRPSAAREAPPAARGVRGRPAGRLTGTAALGQSLVRALDSAVSHRRHALPAAKRADGGGRRHGPWHLPLVR
eukprot:scaffold132205_cov33-Tisochrysis_lutea.AAC.6